jgi:hydrogenase maturation protease
MTAAVRVIGLGNVLMGDDALGPWVIHHLSSLLGASGDVELVDAGTPGLDLTPYLSGVRAIVLVDTVKSDGAPGTLRLYRKAQLLKLTAPVRLSPHDPGVTETLQLLEMEGKGPEEFLLVGVVPENVERGVGLTPPVREAVDAAAELVLLELARLGVPLERARARHEVAPWWEAPAYVAAPFAQVSLTS